MNLVVRHSFSHLLTGSSVQCPGAGRDQCPVSTLWSKVTVITSDLTWPHIIPRSGWRSAIGPRPQAEEEQLPRGEHRVSCGTSSIQHFLFLVEIQICYGLFKWISQLIWRLILKRRNNLELEFLLADLTISLTDLSRDPISDKIDYCNTVKVIDHPFSIISLIES